MVDFNRYVDPGIYINEVVTPVLSVVNPEQVSTLAIVAETQGYRISTQQVTLTGVTPFTLSGESIELESVLVVDRYTGLLYEEGTDYALSASSVATQIQRTNPSAIESGRDLLITFNFTDADYYDVRSFTDYDSVREYFGNPLTSSGTVNSAMTLAAYFAYLNGATSLVAVPVESSDWEDAFIRSNDNLDIDVIVPVSASTAVVTLAANNVIQGQNINLLRRTFVGLDGRVTPSSVEDHTDQAGLFENSRVVAVAPGAVDFFTGIGSTVLTLDGSFAAVAVAGAFAGRPTSTPLTRKEIRGFTKLSSTWSEEYMNLAQKDGVCVLWQKRDGSIVVRHGLTTDMSNIYTQEISIQASKDVLIHLLEDTLEVQSLIGSVITPETPNYVLSAVAGALERAIATNLIYGYSGLKFRQPLNQPTVIEVRFMYKPTLPLNYVQVQFSIDTQTGSANFTEVGV